MHKYYVKKVSDCDRCDGTGAGNAGPDGNECPACGGDGALTAEATLEDALRDHGLYLDIVDHLTALESAVRQLEKGR